MCQDAMLKGKRGGALDTFWPLDAVFLADEAFVASGLSAGEKSRPRGFRKRHVWVLFARLSQVIL